MTDAGLDDPKLLELLALALQEVDDGRDPDLATICGDRPDLVEPLTDLIEVGRRIPDAGREPVAEADLLGGRELDGRYALGRRLGAGAMGVVYEARDQELRRDVAVKLLHAPFLSGADATARFDREAEALAAVTHPAIVGVYDRGRTPDGAYLVLELLEGVSLQELVDALVAEEATPGRVDDVARRVAPKTFGRTSYVRTVVAWAAELADGLVAVHEQGIYHRDVKPSNVFLRTDGRPALLDFGISASEAHPTLTEDGQAIGTPAYMAPEALDSSSEPSAALDVYGLTATLYHLLTLRAPYLGTPSQILTALATKEPPRAETLCPGLHRDLQAILECGMARHPASRYASARALGDDLRAFLEHRPVRARRTTALGRGVRRLWRSPAVRGAQAVTGAVLVLLAGLAWSERADRARRAAVVAAESAVPGKLSLGMHELRRLADDEVVADIRARLDRLVGADPAAPESRLRRAAFLWDHGERNAAVQDVNRMAELRGTPYARALADAWAAAAASSGTPDTDSLPDPDEPLDRFLAAFMARRDDPFGKVRKWLDVPELADHAPSQELLLQEDLLAGDFDGAIERALRVENERGARTATTAGWIGLAMVLDRRHEAALAVLEEGLALCPVDHGMHVNAGIALWALGRYDEAERHYLRAIELKPGRLETHDHLIRVRLADGRLEDAAAAFAAAPFPAGDVGTSQRLGLSGEIEAERALSHWTAGEHAQAEEVAHTAIELFDEAGRYGGETDISRARIARALADGSTSGVCAGVLELLVEEPLNRRRLLILMDWFPEDLSPDESALVRRFLAAQHRELFGSAGS